ncbi:hypothetical protein HPP92_015878 [Vanilla planifolia]|uniref:Uncharacterized protein n=1 Tax=Vanilla planifolia TaxID=51239 RepID=A0A835QM07_VANPL|nr:hypothetical protein HPP92_016483 [Vanilla planifolia]KAG0471332.1 hypothetical protein HPP92_015878 [Vanilla planifolia]
METAAEKKIHNFVWEFSPFRGEKGIREKMKSRGGEDDRCCSFVTTSMASTATEDLNRNEIKFEYFQSPRDKVEEEERLNRTLLLRLQLPERSVSNCRKAHKQNIIGEVLLCSIALKVEPIQSHKQK